MLSKPEHNQSEGKQEPSPFTLTIILDQSSQRKHSRDPGLPHTPVLPVLRTTIHTHAYTHAHTRIRNTGRPTSPAYCTASAQQTSTRGPSIRAAARSRPSCAAAASCSAAAKAEDPAERPPRMGGAGSGAARAGLGGLRLGGRRPGDGQSRRRRLPPASLPPAAPRPPPARRLPRPPPAASLRAAPACCRCRSAARSSAGNAQKTSVCVCVWGERAAAAAAPAVRVCLCVCLSVESFACWGSSAAVTSREPQRGSRSPGWACRSSTPAGRLSAGDTARPGPTPPPPPPPPPHRIK